MQAFECIIVTFTEILSVFRDSCCQCTSQLTVSPVCLQPGNTVWVKQSYQPQNT